MLVARLFLLLAIVAEVAGTSTMSLIGQGHGCGLHRNVCADRNLLLLSRVCREENIDRCGIRCLGRVRYLVDHRGVDHRL